MRTFLVLAALTALALPAQAAEACYTTSTTSDEQFVATVPMGGAVPDLYVANDYCQDIDASDPFGYNGGCVFSIWTYQESNGIPGLQRNDEMVNDVANCTDGTRGDALAFY